MDEMQIIRERAYQIWLREGQPDDQQDAHWRRAEDEIKAGGGGSGKPAAKDAAASGSIGPASDAAGAVAGSIGPSDKN